MSTVDLRTESATVNRSHLVLAFLALVSVTAFFTGAEEEAAGGGGGAGCGRVPGGRVCHRSGSAASVVVVVAAGAARVTARLWREVTTGSAALLGRTGLGRELRDGDGLPGNVLGFEHSRKDSLSRLL